MRKDVFNTGGYYHVYNRGVDKRLIFHNDDDYKFFIKRIEKFRKNNRGTYVDIISYCLMHNHFHMLLKQTIDDGISIFMQKIGISYTFHYNKIYKRTGCLFEGPFKAQSVDSDGYFLHISRYIHLNPLKYLLPDWKSKGVKNVNEAIKFLKDYKWSSYSKLFSKDKDVCDTSAIQDEFVSKDGYDRFLSDWMRYGCPLTI